MRRLIATIFGMLVGGALVFLAFQYHIVRADEKEFLFVPKQQASLADAYVDIRKWEAPQWEKHPQLVRALTQYGRSDLIQRASDGWLQKVLRKIEGQVLPQQSQRDTTTQTE